jgi:hypothetical protein
MNESTPMAEQGKKRVKGRGAMSTRMYSINPRKAESFEA